MSGGFRLLNPSQDGLSVAKPIARHMIRAAGNHDAPAMHDVVHAAYQHYIRPHRQATRADAG